MRRKPIEIAELTAAPAEDQRDFDRRRHHFDRLDRNSAGEENRILFYNCSGERISQTRLSDAPSLAA